MEKINIGINGFGRIGRAFTRIVFSRQKKLRFKITAVNTRKSRPDQLAYLLKYDSVYGRFGAVVKAEEDGIVVDGQKIAAYNFSDPAEIPWDEAGVQIVLDATGAFREKSLLERHLHGGVKRVVLSAPAKDDDMPHIVLGVNNDVLEDKPQVISNASCTTNSASPLFMVLDASFKVKKGFLITTHAYTSSQPLLDEAGKTFTRSRAAALNIVPTTTGAAKAVVRTLPHLKGKIDAMALRVPVPTGSLSIVVAEVEKSTTEQEVNQAFKAAAERELKGILKYEEEALVSSDYIGSSYSAVFDANYTKVLDGNQITVCAWYDNEWGYSTRLVELIDRIAAQL